MNHIETIVSFNRQAGLLDKPYDDFLESSFQIEEALEGFDLDQLIRTYDLDADGNAKSISRALVETCVTNLPDIDRLDKAIDAYIYAVGSIAKLQLTPEQISRAIEVVTTCNQQKLNMPKDEHGKLTKPPNFVGPEPQLQSILDERP
jgi:hypothetical protein